MFVNINGITPDFYLEVAKGNVAKHSIFSAIGERENVGVTTNGEDIWRGIGTMIPIPPSIGEQMTIVSSNINDILGGTGVEKVKIHYIDANGVQQIEVLNLNGTVPVNTVATNIRFVNDMYSIQVGSNGVSEGNIIIYQLGSPATIYNLIAIGGNKSLVPTRMVPIAHTLILKQWEAFEATGKRQTIRIRSTDMNGVLLPNVFCFKDVAYLNKMSTGNIELNILIPALSIIKVSSWAILIGGEVSVSWWGVLIQD